MEVGIDMPCWIKHIIQVWYPKLENCASLRPFPVSLSRLAQRSPRQTDGRRGRGVDGRGGNSRIEAAAAERCAGRRKEGGREGLHTRSWLCLVCLTPAKRRREGDPIGRKGERTRGRRAVIPVCLFRLGAVPNPESQQDGEADGGDDRGPDEGVRHGERQETQLLVSARDLSEPVAEVSNGRPRTHQ